MTKRRIFSAPPRLCGKGTRASSNRSNRNNQKNRSNQKMALFALLVGINHYDPKSTVHINDLSGCSNDIGQLQAFLETSFPPHNRHIVTLLNEQATYAAVVHHFGKAHLLRAGKDDIVLIAYSGHGSREVAAPEWGKYYGEGKEETWVCYDSRTAAGYDLADKELAFLIEAVAQRGAHVTTIMDCCHSGSGTRFLEDIALGAARQHNDRKAPRPWESYLNGDLARRFPDGKDLYLPNSRHILLAACDRKEKAWEIMTQQGLFSSQYLKILEETSGKISYSDLFIRCRADMMRISDNQHPQFEPYGYFNAYQGFLGLTEAQSGAAVKIYRMGTRWMATQGAVHQLPVDQTSVFEVIQDGKILGRATTTSVGLEESNVRLTNLRGESLDDTITDPNFTCEARLTTLPTLPLIFHLTGDAAQKAEIKTALAAYKPLYFGLQEDSVLAPYRMDMTNDSIRILRNADGMMIREVFGINRSAVIATIFQAAEHLARWEKTLTLENRKTQIKASDIDLILCVLDDAGQEIWRTNQPEVMLEMMQPKQKIRFHIEVRNNNAFETLHCALFYGSSSYGFGTAGFNEPILPGKSAIAAEGSFLTLNGKNSGADFLKLFVSQQKIAFANMEIEPLKLGEIIEIKRAEVPTITKDIGGGGLDLEEDPQMDWRTLNLSIRTAMHYPVVGQEALSLAGGEMVILPHPTFRASAALIAPGTAAGYREPAAILTQYAAQNNLKILRFLPPTTQEALLSVLMLSHLEHAADLATTPLKIQLDAALTTGRKWQVLAFDGDKIQVAGSVKTENGVAMAYIQQLWIQQDGRRQGSPDFAQLVICEQKD
jgi:hypothetical protein